MLGAQGYRYANRYTVDEVDHTDKSKQYIANLKADFGVYKDDLLALDGDVSYVRDDGLIFQSQRATYDKKTTMFVSDTDFVSYRGDNVVRGTYVDHNDKTGKIHIKNVDAVYDIQ